MNLVLKNGVVVVAAGAGLRMGGGKVWRLLAGKPVLAWVLELFLKCQQIDRVVVVIRDGDQERFEALIEQLKQQDSNQFSSQFSSRLSYVLGGAERQDSVYCGLAKLAEQPPQRVLIHDGARPLCSESLVKRVLSALESHNAVMPAVPIVDTIRRTHEAGWQLVDRKGLMQIQTPQGFWWETIWQAHCLTRGKEGYLDDAEMVIQAGGKVQVAVGSAANIKLTTNDDFIFAENVLS